VWQLDSGKVLTAVETGDGRPRNRVGWQEFQGFQQLQDRQRELPYARSFRAARLDRRALQRDRRYHRVTQSPAFATGTKDAS
jgi:hypothetical protein